MNILALLAPDPIPRWQRWLLEDVRALPDCSLIIRRTPTAVPVAPPRSVSPLLDLERRAGRGVSNAAHDLVVTDDLADVATGGTSTADLVIDLAGARRPSSAARTLAPLFDGAPDPAAIWTALLAGRAPQLTLADSMHSVPHPLVNPAIEDPSRLSASFDAVAARLVEAVGAAVRDLIAGRSIAPRAILAAAHRPAGSATRFLSRSLATKVRTRLDRRRGHAPQWAVAVRRIGDEPIAPGPLELSRYLLLPDDGQRYYADPFVFAHEGRTWLFVEEVPGATGRGLISVTELTGDHTPATPRPVLERPYHLSYPQVFERDGAVWMLPEAAASGALELYRAETFPDRWVLAARLIDEPLHDATLFEHGGQLWIEAGHCSRRSSTWDGLSFYRSDSLLGPWRPHALNPVLLDVSVARPAGHLVRQNGELLRPAQDCTTGYGSALALNRIDRLDPDVLHETRLGRIYCDPASGLMGPHTLNRVAGYEAIDLYGSRGALSRVGSAASWQPGRNRL